MIADKSVRGKFQMGNIILSKHIPRMKTQRGSEYTDKDNVKKQYGMVKVQDLAIPIGIDVEIKIEIREYDKDKVTKEV